VTQKYQRCKAFIERQEQINQRLEKIALGRDRSMPSPVHQQSVGASGSGRGIPSDATHLALLIRAEQAEAKVAILEQEVI
jgi:hypothetical protein